jgi:glucose-6-phosphate 1-epimerase
VLRAGAELDLELKIENRAQKARRCEAALHTCFSVGDIRQASVYGLQGAPFVDKTRGGTRDTQHENVLLITGETDRVSFSSSTVEIWDAALGRKIVIEKTGANATVVWNPWIAKAAALPDFGDDEWQTMLCVETAAALDTALHIEAGATHTLTTRIRVESL